MPTRKVAAYTRVSQELLADSPAAASYLQSRLSFAVLREEENQILFGDGEGSNLSGIFKTEGVQAQDQGSFNAPDAIQLGIARIATFTDFEASGIIMHPLDWSQILLLKSEGSKEYLVGNIFVRSEMGTLIRTPSLWGLPVVVTRSAQIGSVLIGDFARAAQLFRRTGLLIEMSNQDADNFTKNLVTVLAELRALVATYAPAAFCEVTLTSGSGS